MNQLSTNDFQLECLRMEIQANDNKILFLEIASTCPSLKDWAMAQVEITEITISQLQELSNKEKKSIV
jgi:hypothetical protein